MKFTKETVENLIKEEYYVHLIEKECKLLSEVWNSEKAQAVATSRVLRPTQISPVDKYPGFEEVLADPASVPADISAAELAKEQYEFLQQLAGASAQQIENIDVYWQKYLNLGGSIRQAMEASPSGIDIIKSLEKLYHRLRNRDAHNME